MCQEERDPYTKVEYIIDHMRRRPDEDYVSFVMALINTNQSHIYTVYLQPEEGSSSKGRIAQPTEDLDVEFGRDVKTVFFSKNR